MVDCRNAAALERQRTRALATIVLPCQTACLQRRARALDYDKTDIASHYDQGRTMQPGMLDMWLERVAAHVSTNAVADIIDLGCGTGRFSVPLADRFGARVVGLDPSEKMLDAARRKSCGSHVSFCAASAESIPLPDESVDLVFISMAFHHFVDRQRAASEMRRVLRASGHVCLRNSTSDQRSPYAPFFPGYQELADKILPTAQQIMAAFGAGGFALCAHELIPHLMAPSWAALAEKAATRSDSILLRLPHASFVEGIMAMRAQAPSAPDEFVGMNVDFFVFEKSAGAG